MFEKAKEFEDRSREKYVFGEGLKSFGNGHYTWIQEDSLDEIVKKAETNEEKNKMTPKKVKPDWKEVLLNEEDEDPEDQACLICSL